MPSNDAIFLVHDNTVLERINSSQYISEDVLQELIARHPELLAGDQIDPDNPPRWLLVSREAGIPDTDGAGDRWAVDHLLLDQNARPTFVEIKRSSDTRIRREVVGQMLDYAANATRYWPTDRIRTLAAQECGGAEALDRQIADLIGMSRSDFNSGEIEAYWNSVDDNLREGNVRLLFVADELPRELCRVIEFLNEHMNRVDVLGVELRQYEGASVRALVPRVVGRLERMVKQPEATSSRLTTEPEFKAACPDWAWVHVEEVLRTATADGFSIGWGTKGFSVRSRRDDGRGLALFYVYPPAARGIESPWVEIYLEPLTHSEDDLERADQLRKQLTTECGMTESGNYTLRLELNELIIEQLLHSYLIVKDVYDELA